AEHGRSAGGRRAPPVTLRLAERREPGIHPSAAPAHVRGGRADVCQTVDVGDPRGSYRARLLSGISAQRERRRGDPLALRPSPSGVVDPWPQTPDVRDVLLVDATGRDHPRRAGLALHLAARLDVPSIGVTGSTLMAEGAWRPDAPGATSRLRLGAEVVGFWGGAVPGARALTVH